jgi:hypothetical protein
MVAISVQFVVVPAKAGTQCLWANDAGFLPPTTLLEGKLSRERRRSVDVVIHFGKTQ